MNLVALFVLVAVLTQEMEFSSSGNLPRCIPVPAAFANPTLLPWAFPFSTVRQLVSKASVPNILICLSNRQTRLTPSAQISPAEGRGSLHPDHAQPLPRPVALPKSARFPAALGLPAGTATFLKISCPGTFPGRYCCLG